MGETSSTDFPMTTDTFDIDSTSEYRVYITKFNPDGESLEYSTILSGSDFQTVTGIAVDNEGCAHITGYTSSTDFPTTEGAYDSTFNSGSDCFITKLNPEGSDLVFSTFLGGGEGSSNSMLVPIIILIVGVVAGSIFIIVRKRKGKEKEKNHDG